MSLKSSFKSDLQKEKFLGVLLDSYYNKYLKNYNFKRVNDLKSQLKGIDLIFTSKENGQRFFVDEKAQLDYINEDLPTFAFELSYFKNEQPKKGWLFDADKVTDFYALITGIYADEPQQFTSCKITFVNRAKLIRFLNDLGLTETFLLKTMQTTSDFHGKKKIQGLNQKNEGYLFFSRFNKAEKPVNLILKLDFLIANGIAKRLV